MQVTVIYAISYASAIGLLVIWRLSQCLTVRAREHIVSFLSKWLLYTVIYPRLNGSSDVTIMAGSTVVLFIVANIVGSVIGVHSRLELSVRLSRMCVTNLLVLYLGGRSNFLVDKIFRLSTTEYHLLHRWIGRITLIEGLIHGTLCIIDTGATTKVVHLTVSSLDFIDLPQLSKISFILSWPRLHYCRSYTSAAECTNYFSDRISLAV
jgi:hypothetical protein